jgi:hypothetical protein
MKINVLLAILILIVYNNANSQTDLNVSSGYLKSSEGSFSYSFGATFYNTHSSATGSVKLGIQQVFSANTSTAVTDVQFPQVIIYPNPTSDILTVDLTKTAAFYVYVELFDQSGKRVLNERVERRENIYIGSLPSGVYILSVNSDSFKQLYKIVKY